MANDAQVSIQATILPDEIAKTLTGTMTVAPADANDKWYYKLTACTTTSTDLIAGNFIDYTAVDDDTAPTAIAAGDKVKFLFIQNTSSADDLVDGVFIGPSQTWFGRLPNTTVANLHAVASDEADAGDATANLIVAALIDDVG
jgi:hypothetical protein